MKYAIDCSNYTGVINQSTIDRIREYRTPNRHGRITHAMIGTQVPSVCNQQARIFKDNGFSVDIYVQLEPTDIYPSDRMVKAKYAVEDFPEFFASGHSERVFIAAEAQPPYDPYKWLQDAKIGALRQGFKRVGIYTRKGWWDGFMAGSEVLFTTLPLWYANYDDNDWVTPRLWRAQGFGGWWKPTWKQYVQNVYFNGQVFDLNVSP